MNQELSKKVGIPVAVAAIVILCGIVFFFIRRSDPAAQGPIPYKHMDRDPSLIPQRPGGRPTGPSSPPGPGH